MLRGTIEKIEGGRVPFEFTDHGELRPGVYTSSFRIDGGPFIESVVDLQGVAPEQMARVREEKDSERIRKAGAKPETHEFK